MEIFGVDVPNYVFVSSIVLIALYLYGRITFSFFDEYGLKGPTPTAYFGNMIEMGKVGFSKVFFKWNKKYGDTYRFFFGAAPVMVVNDPEIIGEIMVKRFSNFPNRPPITVVDDYTATFVTAAFDDHWKYVRTVLAPSYSSKKMREMVPMINDVMKTFEKHMDKLALKNESADFFTLFTGYAIDVIASTGFGVKLDSQENLDSPLVKNALLVFGIDFFKSIPAIGVLFPTFAKIVNKFKPGSFMGGMAYFIKFCKQLLDERKKDPNKDRKDLLQLMVNAQLEGHEKLDKKTEQNLKLENVTDWRIKRGLTDLDIVAQLMIMFFTGYDTAATTLAFLAHSIALNPDIQDKICQEIDDQLGEESPNYDNVLKLNYLRMCLDETLRLYPVGFFLARVAKEDCTIKGLKIPKYAGILIPTMCLHYDPRHWSEPEKFDPERFNEENKPKQTPFTYLPFGGGPRICVGQRLAEMEIKITMVHLLRKFRFVTCEKTEKKVKFGSTALLKPKNGIWLKVEHR